MKKRCYILRHGETAENSLGIVQGSGIDSELNAVGKRQADFFYRHYQHLEFDLMFASGLKRSYQTIHQFEASPEYIVRDSRLNEICWGEHEGKRGEPELMQKYWRIIESWKNGFYHDKPLQGESAEELGTRLLSFIEHLQVTPFRQALICTHGRTLRAMMCLLKAWPLKRMEEIGHNNTGLYVAEFNNGGWEVLLENDRSHLLKMQSS